jgi:chemosensory pili system protein ChpA (sensor histidine kinase/response regulator)
LNIKIIADTVFAIKIFLPKCRKLSSLIYGRGIDAEKVRRLAQERKLIAENSAFDERKAGQIIFLSGFSTAAAVTEDAGRGVGLDAVKTAVLAAGGTIEVNSGRGRGTAFLICFPAADENFPN